MKLQSETNNEVHHYRILTNKTPYEIGKAWAESKTTSEWEKENTLTDFLGKYPDVASQIKKFENLEKILSESPEPLPVFATKDRNKNLGSGLSL